jgi:hypothetical protein
MVQLGLHLEGVATALGLEKGLVPRPSQSMLSWRGSCSAIVAW